MVRLDFLGRELGVDAIPAVSLVLISGFKLVRQTSKRCSSWTYFQPLLFCFMFMKESSWLTSVLSLKGKLQSAVQHTRHSRDNQEDDANNHNH